ncbi:DMT family transporter [Grimontia kaedaensis]|uniref:DMT family transporter n=1 Tax=Grimontia kaedaensis TaxID=2872157 RepID=A0ABY4WPK1_9GAMM|nr:DMT family transporter [Grimontia kaedaensis]USH01424.1 DMT family transporter [Grimontia kaedaensis]
MSSLTLMALAAGGCIAIQAAMNAQLGQMLGNSWLATSYAFLTSFVLVSLAVAVLYNAGGISASNTGLDWEKLTQIPWYLWLSCVFSVIGVGSLYFLIPKMGVGNLMSYSLAGQIIIAMLLSHFGAFDSPIKSISAIKLFGAALLVLGIVLINKDFS